MQPFLNYEIIAPKNNNGKQKTVLFLHGWGGSTSSFFYIQKQLSNYKTINLDFYGFGKSSELAYPYDTYLYALSIYELLLKLNETTVTIVSHSFGGRIAILLSSIFNIKVEKLILISSAGIKPRRFLGYYLKVYLYKFCKFLVNKKIVSKKLLKLFGSSDYKQLNNIMKATLIKVVNQNLRQYLKLINSPTLIVWGLKDKITPYYMAKILHKQIKNSTLLVYKKSGHFCYLENLNKFCNTLQTYLD
jgi:pimeloyl-ACP methyl ester carboxylesterase